jgi:hypothetical protein
VSLVVAGSLVLAACGSGAKTASPASGSATPGATATPEATAMPEASGRTLVSGSMACIVNELDPEGSPYPTAEVLPSGVERQWFDLTCTFTMSDPRVSGTQPYIYLGTVVDVPDLPGGTILWDNVPLVLTTAGGTWKGLGMGADYLHEPTLYTVGHTVYVGEGAYAGLTYTQMWARDVRYPGPNAPYLVSGWIESTK